MKLILLIGFFIALSLNTTFLSAGQLSNGTKQVPDLLSNLPPFEINEAPPEPIVGIPPIYLDVDSRGNVYRKKTVQGKSGAYEFSDELVSEKTLKHLRSQQDVILQNRAEFSLIGEGASQSSSSSCPLPSSFTIQSYGAGVFGDLSVENTNRPSGTNTQWIVFDFYTRHYRNVGSHMPIVLFSDSVDFVLHGWGSFIGDNRLGTNHDPVTGENGVPPIVGCSNGFNSQIEGWYLDEDLDGDPAYSEATWQDWIFPDSCGNEMYDGSVVIVPTILAVPKYRMEMQASTGHWVAYRILKFSKPLNDWETLTDWKVLDVDTGDWLNPYTFNSAAQGIRIFATETPSAWSIHISNAQCGWF